MDDNILEGDEDLTFVIDSIQFEGTFSIELGALTTHVLTITDNDGKLSIITRAYVMCS